MSLHVYLRSKTPQPPRAPTIFIREDGQTRPISQEEWRRRFPDRAPVLVHYDDSPEAPYDTVYSANITHNLGEMARHAGLYGVLWRPETCGIRTAADLQGPLGIGLDVLRTQPDWFAQWNPPNGWGTYEGLVRFVDAYRAACLAWPEADVDVSR